MNTTRDKIRDALESNPAGLSVGALSKRLGASPSVRTLQRHLAELVKIGEIQRRGKGPRTEYFIELARATDNQPAATQQHSPWISTAGRQVRAAVTRPIDQRVPVGYQGELLDAYVPNVTSYLSPAQARHLHQVGRSASSYSDVGTFARDVLSRLLIDLSWASSKLEGNTYTRLDTDNLIEFGQFAAGKDQREATMILNHKAAIEMLVDNIETIAFDRHTILNLHALLSANLMHDPKASGRLRTRAVEISGTTYIPLAIPQRIAAHFQEILMKAAAIDEPFEQSLFIMVHLPYLQPFEDANKRTSRLAANIPLLTSKLAPLSFVDVPARDYVDALLGVYELQQTEMLRDIFIWSYERSSASYSAVRDSLPSPDPVRLRTRFALTEVVGDVVRELQPIDLVDLTRRGEALVEPADLQPFAAIAFNELNNLHEGNVARFKLRLSEFLAWKRSRQ